MPWTLYRLDSSIIPVLEMRRLRFRNPTSAAKDHTPMEWKSWYSSPRLGTSKTVFFPPGYPALNPVIICYLQTPSITELKKHLELQQIGKALLPSIVLVSPFPVSYPSSSLPPCGLFYMSSFLSKNHSLPSCSFLCFVLLSREESVCWPDLGL